jgi:hypothetical protein
MLGLPSPLPTSKNLEFPFNSQFLIKKLKILSSHGPVNSPYYYFFLFVININNNNNNNINYLYINFMSILSIYIIIVYKKNNKKTIK